MVLANRYFKGVGSTQTSIFSPNTVFHFFALQPGITAPCLFSSVFFNLCLATALSHQSLKFQIALVTDFPRVIIITSVYSGGVLTLLIKKLCHKGLLHLQKIVSQSFSANREPHTATANLNIQKWHVYHYGCQGRKLQRKNFHKEKD